MIRLQLPEPAGTSKVPQGNLNLDLAAFPAWQVWIRAVLEF